MQFTISSDSVKSLEGRYFDRAPQIENVPKIGIIGGGITGTSLAYYLRSLGSDVTVYEKNQLGAGTTGKSIACFGWYPLSSGIKFSLATHTWNLYSSLISDEEIEYRLNGMLRIPQSKSSLTDIQRHITNLQNAGIPAKNLAPDDVHEHNVNPDIVTHGAGYFPNVGRVNPTDVVTYFSTIAREAGVILKPTVEILNIEKQHNSITEIRTTQGTESVDILINAAGPWAPLINDMVGLHSPFRHSLAPIIVLETTHNFALPTVALDSGQYFSGEQTAAVLAGYTPQEDTGNNTNVEGLQNFDPDAHLGTGSGIVKDTHRYRTAETAETIIPHLVNAKITNEWQGVRCHTPDDLPIVGFTNIKGYGIISGMNGWGITLGPACSQLLAEGILSKEKPTTYPSLSPKRF